MVGFDQQYVGIVVWWGDGDFYGVVGVVVCFVQCQFYFVWVCFFVQVFVVLVVVGEEWEYGGEFGGGVVYFDVVIVLFYGEFDLGVGSGVDVDVFFVDQLQVLVGVGFLVVVVFVQLVEIVQFVLQVYFEMIVGDVFVVGVYVYDFEVDWVFVFCVLFGIEFWFYVDQCVGWLVGVFEQVCYCVVVVFVYVVGQCYGQWGYWFDVVGQWYVLGQLVLCVEFGVDYVGGGFGQIDCGVVEEGVFYGVYWMYFWCYQQFGGKVVVVGWCVVEVVGIYFQLQWFVWCQVWLWIVQCYFQLFGQEFFYVERKCLY